MGPHPHGIVKGEIIGFQPRSPCWSGTAYNEQRVRSAEMEVEVKKLHPWIENNGYSYS